MANELYPFFDPGDEITSVAQAAVTGKRCVAVTGDLNADGLPQVSHAAAAGRIFGVAKYDAVVGGKVGVFRKPGAVVPILAAAAIAAFAEVEVGANGQVIPIDRVARPNSVAIGYALTAALINTDAQICLY